jgi:hypothetical protein
MPQLVGMEWSAGPAADRSKSAPARLAIDATGPPVLNPAAAGVLLRILLRAAERDGMTNATRAGNCPVLSDS